MAGGRLSDRIRVQRMVREGSTITGWADLELTPGVPLVLWADMNETPGGDTTVGGRQEAARKATIRLRATMPAYQVEASDRIVARGAVWKIRGAPAQSEARADVLVIACEEWVQPPDFGD